MISADYLNMLPTGARVAAIDARNVQKRRQSLAEEKAEQKAFLRQFHNLPGKYIKFNFLHLNELKALSQKSLKYLPF